MYGYEKTGAKAIDEKHKNGKGKPKTSHYASSYNKTKQHASQGTTKLHLHVTHTEHHFLIKQNSM